jgi:hypothetical protein
MEIIKGSRKDYYPIGTIFQRKNGKCYEVVETKNGTCAVDDSFTEYCAFLNKSCYMVKCVAGDRSDEIGAIFIRRKDLESND